MQPTMIRIVFLLAVLFPTLSPAMSVDKLFVFGDSLSDGGNVYNLFGFPPSPPYQQRFSNGPVAIEQFATMVGVTLTPSTVNGSNYAYGGAATGVMPGTVSTDYPDGIDNYLVKSIPIPPLNGTGIQHQVEAFAKSGIPFQAENSLFMVWGGPNDIFTKLDGFSTATINDVIANAVNNIITSIGKLAGTGAENFLIPNMVDLGMTPFGIGLGGSNQTDLTDISNAFNAFLNQGLDAIVNVNKNTNIFRPDINNLLQLIQADPTAYGFDNATEKCFDKKAFTVCNNPDRYLFWDDVHPTERGHALIAGNFYSTAIPEPSVIALISVAIFIRFYFRATSFRRKAVYLVK